jgi:hypothetical protein
MDSRTPEYRWGGQMEIFKNLALMYGQNLKNVPPKCSDCSRHWPKKSNLFRLFIRPQKTQNLFGAPIFVLTGPKNGLHPEWQWANVQNQERKIIPSTIYFLLLKNLTHSTLPPHKLLHHGMMFGWSSGSLIFPQFYMDKPSGMLWHFDQKCSDCIRQKAKNFSKSVRTVIWVCHLYLGVLGFLTQFYCSIKLTLIVACVKCYDFFSEHPDLFLTGNLAIGYSIGQVLAKAEHECTHGWPGSVPTCILILICHN